MTAGRVEVAVVRPDDYPEVASFMAAFPGVRARSVGSWLGRLRAWWELNPAFEESFPRGWVLRDEGRIGGFFGSLPLRIQLGGAETTAFAATSWRVLPAYRGKSLALKLRQLEEHKEHLHFSTTPRADLVPLLQRLGYRQIDRGLHADRQSQFILDGRKFWRARLPDSPLRPALAAFAAPVLALAQALRARGLARAARGDVRELAAASAAFDDLWARTRTRFANTNVRSSRLVNWYCFAMQPSNRILLASHDGGALAGFMVLLIKEDPDRRFLECVDLWIDPAAGEACVLASLVAAALERARGGGFERVLFPHFDARTARLYRGLGLLDGPAWTRREYVKGPPELLQAIVPGNSYFVRAQGDYGL